MAHSTVYNGSKQGGSDVVCGLGGVREQTGVRVCAWRSTCRCTVSLRYEAASTLLTKRCSDAGCLHAMMTMVNIGLLHAFRLAGDRREAHSGGGGGGAGTGGDADVDKRGSTGGLGRGGDGGGTNSSGRGGGGVGRDLDTDNTAPRWWRSRWCCSRTPSKKTNPY